MKEEKESEFRYARIIVAKLWPAANQSCVARFQKSFFSELLSRSAIPLFYDELCHRFKLIIFGHDHSCHHISTLANPADAKFSPITWPNPQEVLCNAASSSRSIADSKRSYWCAPLGP